MGNSVSDIHYESVVEGSLESITTHQNEDAWPFLRLWTLTRIVRLSILFNEWDYCSIPMWWHLILYKTSSILIFINFSIRFLSAHSVFGIYFLVGGDGRLSHPRSDRTYPPRFANISFITKHTIYLSSIHRFDDAHSLLHCHVTDSEAALFINGAAKLVFQIYNSWVEPAESPPKLIILLDFWNGSSLFDRFFFVAWNPVMRLLPFKNIGLRMLTRLLAVFILCCIFFILLVDIKSDFGPELFVSHLRISHDLVLFERNRVSGIPIFLPSLWVHTLKRMSYYFLISRRLLGKEPIVVWSGSHYFMTNFQGRFLWFIRSRSIILSILFLNLHISDPDIFTSRGFLINDDVFDRYWVKLRAGLICWWIQDFWPA